MSSNNGTTQPVFEMRMGCTRELITFRAAGNEGVCLQSPEHGMQTLDNFNVSAGDLIGVDDILELTTAKTDLSDVANWITAQVSSAGTTLYFDPTGTGKVGTAFVLLAGVTTSVAQLVADGGMKYVPDAITVTPAFNTPLTMRPCGLETVDLRAIMPTVAPQQINGFIATSTDILQLSNILNKTLALTNLSNIASYITATTAGGNTTLSLDPNGGGHGTIAFAVLQGVTVTVAQLVADHALAYNPTAVEQFAKANMSFIYRSAGSVNLVLTDTRGTVGAGQIQGFSLPNNDAIDVVNILAHANITTDLANVGNFFSTVETGGNTQLWFDPNGSGHGGTLEATFQGASFTMNDLLSHAALNLT